MTHDEQISILHKANATRGELREALAAALGNPPLGKAAKAATTVDRTVARDYWCAVYEKRTGTPYYWSAKDAGSLKQLINKIAAICATPADVLPTFQALINNLPKWYISNAYSVAIVNSKFNELIASIRNERTGQTAGGATDGKRAELARRAAGNTGQ